MDGRVRLCSYRTGTLQLPGIVPHLARYHGNWLSVLG